MEPERRQKRTLTISLAAAGLLLGAYWTPFSTSLSPSAPLQQMEPRSHLVASLQLDLGTVF